MTANYRWTTTRLHHPGTAMLVSVGAVFTAGGVGLLVAWFGELAEVPEGVQPFSRANWDEYGHLWVMAALGWSFSGLGGLVFVLGLRNLLAPGTVHHVAAAELAIVPSRPLLGVDADTHSAATHVLQHGRLEPDRRPVTGRRIFLFTFSIAFGAFVPYLLWFTQAFGDKSSTYVIVGVLAIGMLLMVSFVIDYMMRGLGSKLVTLDFSKADGWRIVTEQAEVAAGRREDLVAVQLAAARVRVTHNNRTTITNAIELNLAYQNAEGELERQNLMRTNGAFRRVAGIAMQLAAGMNLPLLYHSTSKDWHEERRRSRRRRAGRGSIT